MGIKRLIILSFLLYSSVSFGQKLSVGLGFHAPIALLGTTEKSYNFADDASSKYTIIDYTGLSSNNFLAPSLYLNYFINDNWFIRAETGYFFYQRNYKVVSSDNSNLSDTTSYKYNYQFLNTSFVIGRQFLRTKPLRINYALGFEVNKTLSLREQRIRSEELLLRNLAPFGTVIHQDINSLKNQFISMKFNLGLEYYILSFDVDTSINLNPGISGNNFYKDYISADVNLKVRLFGHLIKGKKVRNEKL